MKNQADKKNEVNWCMQYIALFLGLALILMGSKLVVGFWQNFKTYNFIYIGVVWLFIAYIHRLKWLHKRELCDAALKPTDH